MCSMSGRCIDCNRVSLLFESIQKFIPGSAWQGKKSDIRYLFLYNLGIQSNFSRKWSEFMTYTHSNAALRLVRPHEQADFSSRRNATEISLQAMNRRSLALCRLVETVAAVAFSANLDEMRAPTRCRAHIAFARQVAMYLAHISFGLSFTDIGRCFERDRTTVAHACRLVEDRRDEPGLDTSLDYLEAAVRLRAEEVGGRCTAVGTGRAGE